ncbi:MAG: PHP domain-containing protein [Acetatifactor sp.]|nr:PHP domain-containing protein [Acetatifactor sp.]
MRPIDLHVHSKCSDGTYTPSELVDYACKKGLAAFALTDHDTIDGLEEAIAYAAKLRATLPAEEAALVPEVIPGIELSTEYQGADIHMVGLYIDYRNPQFLEHLQEFIDSRTVRNRKMCQLLQEHGINITYEALTEAFPDAVITRAHYARYMMEHGYIKSIKEAFDRYVGDDCPCYIPREKITPAQGVELILMAGGIPVLAHPILYKMSKYRLDALVAELKEAGLMGIEAIYSTYHAHEEREIRELAAKYDLLISGGSDFHGANKKDIDLGTGLGRLFVPEDLLAKIKAAKN